MGKLTNYRTMTCSNSSFLTHRHTLSQLSSHQNSCRLYQCQSRTGCHQDSHSCSTLLFSRSSYLHPEIISHRIKNVTCNFVVTCTNHLYLLQRTPYWCSWVIWINKAFPTSSSKFTSLQLVTFMSQWICTRNSQSGWPQCLNWSWRVRKGEQDPILCSCLWMAHTWLGRVLHH